MSENICTKEYLLSQIAKIQEQTEYLNSAIETISLMQNNAAFGDIQGQAKAQALSDIVRCRETTNQKLLALYEKMYYDLMPVNNAKKLDVLDKLAQIAANTDEFTDDRAELLNSIRQIFKENFND